MTGTREHWKLVKSIEDLPAKSGACIANDFGQTAHQSEETFMDASHSQHKSNAHNPLTRRILFLTLYLFVGSLFALSGASSVWAGTTFAAGQRQ